MYYRPSTGKVGELGLRVGVDIRAGHGCNSTLSRDVFWPSCCVWGHKALQLGSFSGRYCLGHGERHSYIAMTNGYPRRWAMPFALPISLLRYLGAAACDCWGIHDVGSGSRHDILGRWLQKTACQDRDEHWVMRWKAEITCSVTCRACGISESASELLRISVNHPTIDATTMIRTSWVCRNCLSRLRRPLINRQLRLQSSGAIFHR